MYKHCNFDRVGVQHMLSMPFLDHFKTSFIFEDVSFISVTSLVLTVESRGGRESTHLKTKLAGYLLNKLPTAAPPVPPPTVFPH